MAGDKVSFNGTTTLESAILMGIWAQSVMPRGMARDDKRDSRLSNRVYEKRVGVSRERGSNGSP